MFELIRDISIDGERQTATGTAEIPADYPAFADHFPGWLVLPGTFALELAAQVAGPLCEEFVEQAYGEFRWAVLAGIGAEFAQPVQLPAGLQIEARIRSHRLIGVKTAIEARRDGERVLRGEATFRMAERTPEFEPAIRERHRRLAQWKAAADA